MKQIMVSLMLAGCIGLAQAAPAEPPAKSQQEVANRILRAGTTASNRGDREASAAASKAAQKAREAPTLEEAEQIYKNFSKRNN